VEIDLDYDLGAHRSVCGLRNISVLNPTQWDLGENLAKFQTIFLAPRAFIAATSVGDGCVLLYMFFVLVRQIKK
jgi:hypothetical protein